MWFQFVIVVMIVSFTSVSLVLPAANARTDFTHHPDEDQHETQTLVDPTPDSDTVVEYDREADMAVVDQALSREKVQSKLETIGYTVDEIKERLERLSDEEIHRMAERLEQVKAGGHLGLGEMNIVILIVLVILAPILAIVWVLLMVLGHDIHLHE